MVVRAKQQESMHSSAAQLFEERMVVHLQKCFPSESASLGQGGVRWMIRRGVERAPSYGITTERDTCKYIDIMMVFGRDFDVRPDLPWAAEILNDGVLRSGTAKIERLFDEAKKREGDRHASGRR